MSVEAIDLEQGALPDPTTVPDPDQEARERYEAALEAVRSGELPWHREVFQYDLERATSDLLSLLADSAEAHPLVGVAAAAALLELGDAEGRREVDGVAGQRVEVRARSRRRVRAGRAPAAAGRRGV